jgi:hypothetical protein
MEALKPLLVLGLLGTILYGAFLIMQKGPGNAGPAWQPPAATSQAAMAGDAPAFAPSAPAVEIPAPPVSQPSPAVVAAPPIADLPAAQAAAYPPPAAAAAAPPTAIDPTLPPMSPAPPSFSPPPLQAPIAAAATVAPATLIPITVEGAQSIPKRGRLPDPSTPMRADAHDSADGGLHYVLHDGVA